MTKTRLIWDISPNRLADDLVAYADRLAQAVHDLMEVYSARVVTYAQGNAPWTDRTSNARQGLRSQVLDEGSSVALVLFHSMYYGIFLETRWGGRWGIIVDTLEAQYPNLMSALKALVS